LRPFTAVDLAPKPMPATPAPLRPAVSPFLDNLKDGAAPVRPVDDPADDFLPVKPSAPLPARGRAVEGGNGDNGGEPLPAPEARPAPVHADLPGTGSAIRPRFFLTSTAAVDGIPIQTYLDVVSAEVVVPKDVLFRNPAPYGELHRLRAAEDQLQKIKAKALEELAEKARAVHADGVVGVTVTFVNLDTVCCLCSAAGTAVRLA
jgi:uncharacterized protein YbjQ (UPF0145 family)